MKPEPLVINVLTFGAPELGVWCETCALPSAVRIKLVGQSGMNVADLGSSVHCPDCETTTKFVERVTDDLPKHVWTFTNEPLPLPDPNGWRDVGEIDDL